MNRNTINIQILLISLLILSVVLLASCTPTIPPQPTNGQELKKFASNQELTDFLKNAETADSGRYYGGMMTESLAPAADVGVASKTTASSGATSTTDFSTTNIQVAGVDEADIVKNDGKYIYAIVQNKLVIVDAFPAEEAKIVWEQEVEGNPRNIFVNNDRLAVFTDFSDSVYSISEFDFVPRESYVQMAGALVYDISDRSNPQLVKNYSITGNYLESRMIGDYVYFVAQESVYYYGGLIDSPVVRASGMTIVKPDVYYFDNPEYNYNFNTIASFNIADNADKEDGITAKTFMLGYANTVYVSTDSIYIAYQKNLPYSHYSSNSEDRFYTAVVPLLPQNVQQSISEIKSDSSLSSQEKWDRISAALEDMYNNMDEKEKEALVVKIQNAIDEYELKLEQERRKSVVHKIGINNGKIDYQSRGEVSGQLLNQFSLDESNEYLRVATTTYVWTRSESQMYNNVYVLDGEMETVGKLEDIAPDERIYSTRFIGDRLYMVTFKRVDPLFVIDLSEPTAPRILGELKIPGFSDYLHPYDENHIIGIGKETESNEWGGVSLKGVKLALFDVSDVENPKQVDEYVIGEQGTDSEALQDHKAFLFDKEKNILAIPIREVSGRYYDDKLGYYRDNIWQGAYVFGITPETGFELKGKISHDTGETEQGYYWGYYSSPNAVRRALYMDNVLYTISAATIKMNDLNKIENELNKIALPFEKGQYDYWPRPMM